MEWKKAWASNLFRKKMIGGLILLVVLLFFFPFFFEFIEARRGIKLNDIVLANIPARDISVPLFILIWSMSLFMLYRCIRDPSMLLIFLWSYIFLCLSRMLTITIIPLEPPSGLIELTDPITSIFYNQKFITRDLFYSGHTATQFLIFLCLQKKNEKIIALLSTLFTGVMVLVQHVHYTIDVVFAPFFCLGIYFLAGKFTKNALPGI